MVSRWGRIAGVVGGMHDFEDYGVLRGLDPIVPCHCTAHKGRIAEPFPEAYEEGEGRPGDPPLNSIPEAGDLKNPKGA